jgi:hypothetical protein
MRLEVLLGGLEHPEPGTRLQVVRVLGMLDETRALPALRARYAQEPDATVQQAIAWAGQRVFEAEQAGYSTLGAIFRFFNIDRELETVPDEKEQKLLEKLQDSLERDLQDRQLRSGVRNAGLALAAGLGAGMIAGTGVGLTTMASTMMSQMSSASSNMGRASGVVRRTPATAPSDANIEVWVRRLRTERDSAQRQEACIELAQLNNPRALPHLAAAFVDDPSAAVRDAAQRYGKVLYWASVYWEITQDGSLAEEIQKRAAALGKNLQADLIEPPAPPAPPPPQGEDIAEILRRAEQARQQRKRLRDDR